MQGLGDHIVLALSLRATLFFLKTLPAGLLVKYMYYFEKFYMVVQPNLITALNLYIKKDFFIAIAKAEGINLNMIWRPACGGSPKQVELAYVLISRNYGNKRTT